MQHEFILLNLIMSCDAVSLNEFMEKLARSPVHVIATKPQTNSHQICLLCNCRKPPQNLRSMNYKTSFSSKALRQVG
jgi:hypothetical protein